MVDRSLGIEISFVVNSFEMQIWQYFILYNFVFHANYCICCFDRNLHYWTARTCNMINGTGILIRQNLQWSICH